MFLSEHGITPENNLETFYFDVSKNNLYPIYSFFQIITNEEDVTVKMKEFWAEQERFSKQEANEDRKVKASIKKFINRAR